MIEENQKIRQHVTLARCLGVILYDFLLLLSILVIISSIIAVIFKLTPEHPYFVIYQAFVFIISFFFYSWFWIHGGQTLGMKTWKIKITNIDGSSVSWNNATIRFVTAIFSWLPLGLGYIWSMHDKKTVHGTTLHLKHA